MMGEHGVDVEADGPRFDGCPVDGCSTDGNDYPYVNKGAEHWFVCHEHRTRWHAATNLFSEWKHETHEEQRIAWSRVVAYREVLPLYVGRS